MFRTTFTSDILRGTLSREHRPNVPYLITKENLGVIQEYQNTTGYDLIKECVSFEIENWQYPQELLNGSTKVLLVWNTGRHGDQLWTTAIVRKIKKLFPFMRIDVVSDSSIWERNKDIRSIKREPIQADLLSYYDNVLIFDATVADRVDTEQDNCYKILFDACGLPFDEKDCVPVFRVLRGEVRAVYNKLLTPNAEGMLENLQGHFVLGLHSNADSRNLHTSQWCDIIATLQKAAPNSRIYGVSSGDTGALIQEKLTSYGFENYVMVNDKLDIQYIAALMRRAACVISVDSLLVHLAASQETACVSLMSTCSPASRVSTYPYNIAVWKSEVCPYAPCFWKHDKLMENLRELDVYSPCYTPSRNMCGVALAIKPNDVISAVGRAIKLRFPTSDIALDESLLPIQ